MHLDFMAFVNLPGWVVQQEPLQSLVKQDYYVFPYQAAVPKPRAPESGAFVNLSRWAVPARTYSGAERSKRIYDVFPYQDRCTKDHDVPESVLL